ncbi:carboxypeptidase-like regulatory domain-containing protein [Hymenobacter pini]|uniref:carboxypeptidase-like regulatory domain-containing protein n=1 Tax=Hymenobacter pini TaxID=2880879 RepID=UPI001CF15F21|nr:carboxypeptidase-like regulatory domain-containing protein [Hymenobacter pini]MCA8829771.1 carboxypeptidase-like regulatory domain-containing protein [Hymenobacter pini]
MHSTLPLVALSLLGALALPTTTVAQQSAEPATADAAKAPLLADARAQSVSRTEKKVLAGNVVDEWGNPLKGATVMIVGDHLHSVSTNSAGDYLLPVGVATPVIRVSFAGYEDAERVARGPADLLFKLEPIKGYRKELKKRTKAATRAWKH